MCVPVCVRACVNGTEGVVFGRQDLMGVDYLVSVWTDLRSKRSPVVGPPLL